MNCKFDCLDCGHTDRVKDPGVKQLSCPKCGGRFIDTWFREKYKKNSPKLLNIELDAYDSVPKVFLNGAEIKNKIAIEFEWETATEKGKRVPFFKAVYAEEENGLPVVKTIIFEDPLRNV